MSNKTKAYYPKDEPLNFWKDIPDTHGIYQINREGEVRKVFKTGKVTPIKPQHDSTVKKPKVVRLTVNGKRKEYTISRLMKLTWMPKQPEGTVVYHINGDKSDSHLENLGYIKRHDLGKRTAHRAKGQAVFKIDKDGNEVDIYRSARAAAKENYMSYQAVIDRCNHKTKNEFALCDYSFRWSKELEKYELVSGDWKE